MRNLINSENELDNYPIGNSPQNNQTLFFENGQFLYKFLSPSGISFSSEGTGISIIKQFLNNNLELKSILGDGNVIASSLSNEVGLSLSNNIKFGDQDILITDEGLSILKTLYFRAKYGILNSIPMSINNQGRIDIFGPMYLNSISVGLPAGNEFLALDINNKIVRAAPSDLTSAINTPIQPGSYGWFLNKVGNELQFRTFLANPDNDNFKIGTYAGSYEFSVGPDLKQIRNINPNPPRSIPVTPFDAQNDDIHFGSTQIYFDNLEIVNQNKFLGIDTLGKIEKRFAIEDVKPSISTETSLVEGLVNYTAYIKRLKAGTNINLSSTATDITLNVNTALNNISSINTTTPLVNLGINSTNISFNQIPTRPALIADKCLYIDQATKNIFYDSTVKTLTHSGIGQSLLSPLGTAEYPILRGLQAGSGISITSSNNVLNIINTAVAGSNIYNSNGTMNSNQRIVSGLNPNDIASNILWDGIIPGYNSQYMTPNNVPIEDNPYSGIIDPTLMMCSTQNGSQGKFLYAPHNYLSQKIEFKLGSLFGETKIIYANFSNLNGSKDFIFQVDLYEVENYLDAFAATWEFTLNSRLGIAPSFYHIKPKTSTVLNYTGQENCIALGVRNTSGIGGSGWEFAFQQQGLGTGAYTSRYFAFIRCNHQGDGSMQIYDNAFLSSPSPFYLNDPVLLFETGLSFPIPYQFSYQQFGKDLKMTFNGSAQQVSGSGGLFQFEVLFNGQSVILVNVSTNSVTNVNTNITFTRILKYVDLLTSGALNLAGVTQITWSLNTTNISMNNLPYEVLLEYI